jgi:hypothetical protein
MTVKQLIANLKLCPPLANVNLTVENPATGEVLNSDVGKVEYYQSASTVRLYSE